MRVTKILDNVKVHVENLFGARHISHLRRAPDRDEETDSEDDSIASSDDVTANDDVDDIAEPDAPVPQLRRSTRERRPVNRLDL